MKSPLARSVQQFIEREQLFERSDRLLLAISGGLDSVVLAHLLCELAYDFTLAHYNFKLRGADSDGDADFARNLATRLGAGFRLQSSNADEVTAMKSGNLQAKARQLRYQFFEQLLRTEKYDYVITAHHLDDNLETNLLNLLRGSGLRGLTGIPVRRHHFRRPFLSTSHQEIIEYAKNHHLLWREDASNQTDDYLRNQLRHRVVPALKETSPNPDVQLANTFAHLRSDLKLLDYLAGDLLQRVRSEEGSIRRNRLPLDRQLAEHFLKTILKDYGFKGDQFRQLLTAKNGSKIVASVSTHQPEISTEPTVAIIRNDEIQLFIRQENELYRLDLGADGYVVALYPEGLDK